MKTLLALLVVTLFCGCASQRAWFKNGGKAIPVQVSIEQNGNLALHLSYQPTLHNVTFDIGTLTETGWFWYRDKWTVKEMTSGTTLEWNLTVGGVTEVDVTGWCDEGRIKGSWTASR